MFYLEFHTSYLLVKDQITAVTLFKGECGDGMHPLLKKLTASSKNIVAYVHEGTTPKEWHKCLVHPSSKLLFTLFVIFLYPQIKRAFLSLYLMFLK